MLTEQKKYEIFEICRYIADIKLFDTQSKSSTLKPSPVSQVTIMHER